jgi:hypothetical protein
MKDLLKDLCKDLLSEEFVEGIVDEGFVEEFVEGNNKRTDTDTAGALILFQTLPMRNNIVSRAHAASLARTHATQPQPNRIRFPGWCLTISHHQPPINMII